MKTFFLFTLLVLFNSNSPEFQGSITIGEPPVFHQTIVFETAYECQQAQGIAAEIASRREDKLLLNTCYQFSTPTRPETAL